MNSEAAKQIKLTLSLIHRPGVFFGAAKRGELGALAPFLFFVVYVFLNTVFLKFKPAGFPASFPGAEIRGTVAGFFFFQIFWQFASISIFSGIFAFLLNLTRKRFASAISLWAVFSALAALALFSSAGVLLHSGLSLLSLLLFAAVAAKRKAEAAYLMKCCLAASMLLALFIVPEAASALMGSESLFVICQYAASIWLLFIYVKAAKTISETHVAKIFFSFAASACALALFFGFVLKADLLSPDAIKGIFLF